MDLIKKLVMFISLILCNGLYANNLVGDYCMPIKWANLIMRFIPNAVGRDEGILSIIHHDSDGPTCLVPDRPYKLENQTIIASGIAADYVDGLLYVSAPSNWSGTFDKKMCFGEPPNPC